MRNSSVIIAIILLIISTLCNTSPYACNKTTVQCGCSRAPVDINARIINGEDTIPSSWTMMVSLKDSSGLNLHLCGGTIISESHILTAAHCVDAWASALSYLNFTIAAGIHNLSQAEQIIRQVDKIIIHPLWTRFPYSTPYDIAILHITEPLDFETNTSITRTCLPPHLSTSETVMQYPLNGTNLTMIGWGSKSTTEGGRSDILQQATVKSIYNREKKCASILKNSSTQFCAGWYESDKGKKSVFYSQWFNEHIIFYLF